MFQLDPGVKKDFATWGVVVFSLGQMLASPVLGLWSNKIKKCSPPIVFGLTLIIVGNILYCCLEAFPPSTAKWIMLFLRFVAGAGSGMQTNNSECEKSYRVKFSGNMSVLRSYCATACTKSERSKAITGCTIAVGSSVIAGPGTVTAL